MDLSGVTQTGANQIKTKIEKTVALSRLELGQAILIPDGGMIFPVWG